MKEVIFFSNSQYFGWTYLLPLKILMDIISCTVHFNLKSMESLHKDFDLSMEIEFIYVYTNMTDINFYTLPYLYNYDINFYSLPYWFGKENWLYWLTDELSLNIEAVSIKDCVLETTDRHSHIDLINYFFLLFNKFILSFKTNKNYEFEK